ncbi:cytochrome P450 family protein [Trema orientale]|uniref:Cytochrome P450 family protein n=1 Tax=Trema orientale TaxID=63057 RepID=A0A2P5EBR6_TREOI|nr:cytochrome P450 family protein [Trema orientale]
MASIAVHSFSSTITFPWFNPKSSKFVKPSNAFHVLTLSDFRTRHSPICCTKLTLWETSSATHAPTEKTGENFMKKTANIFETFSSEHTGETPEASNENYSESNQFQLLKWPMWLLGPSLLLITGMAPTLWLPVSSIFVGPNIASLLSLIGLDFIFNLGATLFLLMADSLARPKLPMQSCKSKPPFSYKFWNMLATITGFIIPLMMLYGSQNGFLQPQQTFITSAVLLGPYILLLSVQMLTEILTWHWQSPVWLVTPVVYEAYRLLQLMRGLKLGAELSAPVWMMHTIRGLVSWWVLILGMQLMRVAWFAGFTARAGQQQASSTDDQSYPPLSNTT